MIKLFSTTGWVATAVAVGMLAASGEVNAQSGYRSGGPWSGGRNGNGMSGGSHGPAGGTRGSIGAIPGGGRVPNGSMARGGVPGGRSSGSGMNGGGRGSMGGTNRGPMSGGGRGPGGIAGGGRGSNGPMAGGGRGTSSGRVPNGGTTGKNQMPSGGKQYAGSAGGGRAPGGGSAPGGGFQPGGGRGNTGGMAGAGRAPGGASGGKTSVPPGGFKYAGSAGGGRAPGGGSAPGGGFQPGGGFNPGGSMTPGGAHPGGGGPFGGYSRTPVQGGLAASGAPAGAIGRSTFSSGGNPGGGRALAYSGNVPNGPTVRSGGDGIEPGSADNSPSWGAEGWNDAWNWHHHRNHHGYWNGGIWYPPTVVMQNQAAAYMQRTQPIPPGSKWLGVTFEPYGGGGAYITGVYEGSPAQAAGLQVGDVIAYVNGADATHLPRVVQQSDGYVDMQILSGVSGEFQQAQVNLVMN